MVVTPCFSCSPAACCRAMLGNSWGSFQGRVAQRPPMWVDGPGRMGRALVVMMWAPSHNIINKGDIHASSQGSGGWWARPESTASWARSWVSVCDLASGPGQLTAVASSWGPTSTSFSSLDLTGWKFEFYQQQNLRIFHNKRHSLSTNFHSEQCLKDFSVLSIQYQSKKCWQVGFYFFIILLS